MDRLTIPDVHVDEHTTRRTMIDVGAVREYAMDFYWRLKAYEDTGLEPVEVKQMANILLDVGQDYNSRWEHVKNWLLDTRLHDLFEADKAGRVGILPCDIDGTMLDMSSPDAPRTMEQIHFSVSYVTNGIIFSQPYKIFLENVAAGYIQPISGTTDLQDSANASARRADNG